MSNTITAYFKGRTGVAESVYKNDYGMVLVFDKIELPAHFDCYFTVTGSDTSIPGVGADNRVAIPNAVLATSGKVEVHIVLHTGENDSEVEYVAYFKVVDRARPVDDGTPTQMTAVEQAIALLQQPITNIEQIVNEALSFTGETFDEMQEDLDDWKEDLEGDLATWKGGVEDDIDDVEADFAILQGQYDTAVAALTVDSECADIRVGDDGVTYTSAGEAVRTQFSNVKDDLKRIDYTVGLDTSAILTFGNGTALTAASSESGARWTYSGGTYSKGTTGTAQYWHNSTFNVNELTYYSVTGSMMTTAPLAIFLDSNGNKIGHTPLHTTGNYEHYTNEPVLTPIGTTQMIVQAFGSTRTIYAYVATISSKLKSKVKSGYLVVPATSPIEVDLVSYKVKFPADTLVIYDGKAYNVNGAAQTVDMAGASSAVKFGYNITNGTFFYANYNVELGDNVFLFSARMSQSRGIFYPDPLVPVLVDGHYLGINTHDNLSSVAEIKRGDFISICHQGYSETESTGKNLLAGYALAAEKGFDYGECDIQMTSDNVPVCCHDSTFEDGTTGDTITIASETYADLITYDYYGSTIASLEEVMASCKTHGIGLVIDQITTDKLPYILPIVKLYAMESRVAYLLNYVNRPTQVPTMIQSIMTFNPSSYVMVIADQSTISDAISDISSYKTGYNKIDFSFNYGANSVDNIKALIPSLPAGFHFVVWTIDYLPTCKNYLPYVTGITSNKVSSYDIFAS